MAEQPIFWLRTSGMLLTELLRMKLYLAALQMLEEERRELLISSRDGQGMVWTDLRRLIVEEFSGIIFSAKLVVPSCDLDVSYAVRDASADIALDRKQRFARLLERARTSRLALAYDARYN